MNKLNRKYSETLQELEALNLRAQVLTEQKRLLEELGAEGGTLAKPRTKTDTRPPRGLVSESILKALTSKGATQNEVRERLKKSGYKYSLHPAQVLKVLNRLAEQKKAKKTTNGSRVEYSHL